MRTEGMASTRSATVDLVDAARAGRRVTNPVVPAPAGVQDVHGWHPRDSRGWVFAAIWLVYLSNTVGDAWHLHPAGRRFAGLLAVALFAAYYLRVFHLSRRLRWAGGQEMRRPRQAMLLGTGVGLTVLSCAVIGQSGTSFAVYIAVVVVLVLPQRELVPAIALIMLALVVSAHAVPGWTTDNSPVFSVFLSALAVWGISQMMARNRQLADANEEISQLAIAQERSRFSRDLHDLLGHSLTVVAVKAELAGRLLATDPQRAAREIADVEQLARTALADVRAAVRGVREVSLAVELASARSALAAADIEASLPGAVDDIPLERMELFGWVVREGVTNVVRHSGARRCTIAVDREAVQIADDGRGPAVPVTRGLAEAVAVPAPDGSGQGLVGLRERADAAGARLSVGHAAGGGFVLRVGW